MIVIQEVNMTFKLSLNQIRSTFPSGRMRMSLKYLLSQETFNFWQNKNKNRTKQNEKKKQTKTKPEQKQKAWQINFRETLKLFLKWHLHFRRDILPQGGAGNTAGNWWPQICPEISRVDSQPAICPQQNPASCDASNPKDGHDSLRRNWGGGYFLVQI